MKALDPLVKFNEYTKRFGAMKRWLRGDLDPVAPGLWMTFSRSEVNEKQCLETLDNGGGVAVVFRTTRSEELPDEWWGYPVIDGDRHDLRWYDREELGDWTSGYIVGLRAKGALIKSRSDFSVEPMNTTLIAA